jgi:hypothetical protein
MKRFLTLSLTLIMITFGLPATSYADEIECPDTWIVDSPEDLTKYTSRTATLMTKTYGPNSYAQKTKKKISYIFDATGENLLVSETPDQNDDLVNNGWALFMALVAPTTQNYLVFNFSIEGCVSEGNFKIPYIVPEAKITKIPLAEWSTNPEIQSKFPSEQVVEKITSQLGLLINRSKNGYFLKGNLNVNSPKYKALKVIPFSVVDPFRATNMISAPNIALLLPAQRDCFEFDAKEGLVIPKGKTCKVAAVMIDQKEITSRFAVPNSKLNLIMLDEFTITAKEFLSTILCFKGKTTKKVSGTNPKCPKGYKKAG